MSPLRVTWKRTLGLARGAYHTSFAVGGFLAAAAALFAFNLDGAEGGRYTIASIWSLSVAPVLPVLAAVLAMDTWSGERASGRIRTLLSAPVRERDYVLGKFFGVWTLLEESLALSLASTLVGLWLTAPQSLSGVRLIGFLPGFAILSLQGALWCAVSVATSAMVRHGAVAAILSAMLTSAVPRGVWAALMAWSPEGRTAFGEMPLDAHAFDFASGVISSGTVLAYLTLTVVALFVATKLVMSVRLVGKGASSLRVSTAFACFLSLVFAALVVMLSFRVDSVLDLPLGGGREFSPRTRKILSEAAGELHVTAYVPRNDAAFRPVGRFLRSLRREAEAAGGVRITLSFVDPRWDFGSAERLVRRGVTEHGLVFEMGRRLVSLPLSEGYGERICASTIQRLSAAPQRRSVYWTFGHGEGDFADYGPFGMSDIARDLARDGYHNFRLDLAAGAQVPSDCALIVVAGAKNDFSRAELDRLDAYLTQGGRLLTLLNEAGQGGVVSMLPSWGLKAAAMPMVGAKTVSGTDVVVSDFSEHAVASALKGSRIVLERPVAFGPSAAVGNGVGADSIGFSAIAKVGDHAVAAAIERGAGAGSDLALRPTRILAVGDASFVRNGPLAARANSNRDFFLNCVSFLAGAASANASGTEVDVLVTGLDRSGRRRLVVGLAAAFPMSVFLLLLAIAWTRRRRT